MGQNLLLDIREREHGNKNQFREDKKEYYIYIFYSLQRLY
jgi:hypothetical protein